MTVQTQNTSGKPVAFVGLGAMGLPMALNLLKGGVDLLCVARRKEALAELAQHRAATTVDIANVGRADVVVLCLPDGDAVRSLLLDGPRLGTGFRAGQIVVDTSTIEYRTVVEISEFLAAHGVTYLDAPISGMAARARNGTLTIMCGGVAEAFDAVQPLLRLVGSDILYMGASGNGQLAKLINQLLFDINASALAELLPLAVKLGLEPELVARVINGGTGRSYASEFFLPNILAGKFHEGYPMRSAYKDLISGADISATQGLPTPVLGAATATYQQALLRGHGDKDKGGMICVFEELFGVVFRARQLQQTSAAAAHTP